MIDRKQVIYDIERCICHTPDACRDCSRYGKDGYENLDCMENLMRDALALLKEQEAVEPEHNLSSLTDWFCGKCGRCISRFHDYCPSCGRAVKWE